MRATFPQHADMILAKGYEAWLMGTPGGFHCRQGRGLPHEAVVLRTEPEGGEIESPAQFGELRPRGYDEKWESR